MKIGIIGSGNMGKALGLAWARAGHEVLFGSRDRAKAETLAREGGGRAGTFDEAASFGEVVLYTLRDVRPRALLADARSLDGKIVVDCNNSDFLDPERFTFPVPKPGESIAERIAADVPKARVVKAFNTHPFTVLSLGPQLLKPQHVSAFIAANDAEARTIVGKLAEDVGLVPVESGSLDRAYLLESVADFLRFQIGGMGRGMFATLSLGIVSTEARHG